MQLIFFCAFNNFIMLSHFIGSLFLMYFSYESILFYLDINITDMQTITARDCAITYESILCYDVINDNISQLIILRMIVVDGFARGTKILWNGRLLTIALAEHYEDDNSDPLPFGTVIVQDGSYLFDKLVEGYPSNVMFVGVEPVERNREYTPWIEDVSGQHYGGEAEQYLDLLEFELIP